MSQFPFTVVAIYHDNDQGCIQHVLAPDPQQAAVQAQIDVYNDKRTSDLGLGALPDEVMEELAPGEVPDQLRILAVFDGHLVAPVSFD